MWSDTAACGIDPTRYFGQDYCEYCDWGEYSDAGNKQVACLACPRNTVITAGKYNTNVPLWCEEDCGTALRYLQQYTSGYDMGDFTQSFPDLPCMRDKTECSDKEQKLANHMIVSPSTKTVLDFNTDRVCKNCDAGKYIKKDTSKAQFFQISCVQCPAGMESAGVLSDIAHFIPGDVKDNTQQLFPDAQFVEADFSVFGCRACSVSQGVPIKGSCERCQQNTANPKQFTQYQHAETVQITELGVSFSLVLGTKCEYCPAGYEYYYWDRNGATVPCRSTSGVLDCCRICQPNWYSKGNGDRCQRVSLSAATDTPFGAKDQINCAVGQELVFCSMDGVCLAQSEMQRSNTVGWRTCRSCSSSDTKRSDVTGCKECKEDKLDIVDKDSNLAMSCKGCNSCQQLITTRGDQKFYEIPTLLRDSIDKWDNSIDIRGAQYQYITAKVTAVCSLLQRRTIKNNEFGSQDEYRPNLHTQEIARVPDFHTLHRVYNNCTITRCADVCLDYFHYSPGCGQQEVDPDKIWISIDAGPTALGRGKYITLSGEDKAMSWYVTHGACQLCETCNIGQYNGMCNVHIVGNNPVGHCQSCLSECPENFFMHHSEQEAGCHAPPVTQSTANNKWKISENYVCQPCPTWVRLRDSISIVTACGFRQKYMGWVWDENSGISAQQQDVSFQNWQSDLAKLGDKYRNYRSFMRDLVKYCPAGYFYDERVPGCDLVQESQTYKVPGTGGTIVSIGFGMYNPNCCQRCTTCPHFKNKDTSNWKACLGDSLSDTQNACVDRCGAMFWENKTASECRRCSTCHAGFLAVD